MLPSWVRVGSVERLDLDRGAWSFARVAPGLSPRDADFAPLSRRQPVAAALEELGQLDLTRPSGIDEHDHWYRCQLDLPGNWPASALRFEALAGPVRVWLDGELLAERDASFQPLELDLSALQGGRHCLELCFGALAPLLAIKRPRPRFKTRFAAHQNLRWLRVPLLGRTPDMSPDAPLVGPYRPIWLEQRPSVPLRSLELVPLRDESGALVRLRATASAPLAKARLCVAGASLDLDRNESGDALELSGTLRLDAEPWWPHTHGAQPRYPARLELDGVPVQLEKLAFRRIATVPNERCLSLAVNDTPVFCRGAVWTPADFLGLSDRSLRARLTQLQAAGFNMLRVVGLGVYESDEFYRLCDELGLLVWQDSMFASLDYPQDEAFVQEARVELRDQLSRIGAHAALAVVAGSSETAQQSAMLGIDAPQPLFEEDFPAVLAAHGANVVYVPSTPWGGARPFRLDTGVCHYYGVGAYGRELHDVRRSAVGFASECLAFSNLPEPALTRELCGSSAPAGARWKAGVPRDPGAGWDFEDVRDTYLERRYGQDAALLRARDPERYLELGRAVSGEVMADVLAELRAMGAKGALIWLAHDFHDGAGVGLVDARGTPKAAYWWVRRICRPHGLVLIDEGLNGLTVHAWNETGAPLSGELTLALYRSGRPVGQSVSQTLTLTARETRQLDVEQLLGRFADISYAYRFGPPSHDLLAVSWNGSALWGEAFHHPLGVPRQRVALEVEAQLTRTDADHASLELCSASYLHAVRVDAGSASLDDQYFCLEPGRARRLLLTGSLPERVSVSALNTTGTKWIPCPKSSS